MSISWNRTIWSENSCAIYFQKGILKRCLLNSVARQVQCMTKREFITCTSSAAGSCLNFCWQKSCFQSRRSCFVIGGAWLPYTSTNLWHVRNSPSCTSFYRRLFSTQRRAFSSTQFSFREYSSPRPTRFAFSCLCVRVFWVTGSSWRSIPHCCTI